LGVEIGGADPGASSPTAPSNFDSQALWNDFINRANTALNGRRVFNITDAGSAMGSASPNIQAAFQQVALAIPLVFTEDQMGSSAVVRVDASSTTAWVITNQHVVDHPFHRNGKDQVCLLFYSPALIGPPFSPQEFAMCKTNQTATARCKAIFQSYRDAEVIRTDKRRDLALLRVDHAPDHLKAIIEARLADVQVGDDVKFIGHPEGYLWSLASGSVSQVRHDYSLAEDVRGITVIQTTAPITKGSSGGPLLTTNLRVIGIAYMGALLPGTGGIEVPAPGLNFAIAVNEVQSFFARAP
jgi:hypothetical protein